MRHPRFAALLAALLVFLSGAACSGEDANRTSEQQHVESFVRAYNAQRVEEALSLFAEDASVSFGDRGRSSAERLCGAAWSGTPC